MDSRSKRLVVAWAGAAVLSGTPSTVVGLARGDDLLWPVRVAGTLVPGRQRHPSLAAGAAAHVAISALWTVALDPVLCHLPRRRAVAVGAVAGLGIAALDLGLVARACPAVRALPQARQWADHAAFGAIVGWAVGRR